jgi:hypothetical protein
MVAEKETAHRFLAHSGPVAGTFFVTLAWKI